MWDEEGVDRVVFMSDMVEKESINVAVMDWVVEVSEEAWEETE